MAIQSGDTIRRLLEVSTIIDIYIWKLPLPMKHCLSDYDTHRVKISARQIANALSSMMMITQCLAAGRVAVLSAAEAMIYQRYSYFMSSFRNVNCH